MCVSASVACHCLKTNVPQKYHIVCRPQGFAKSLLDVADNLERAADAVPTNAVTLDSKLPVEEVVKHLRTLLEGVQLTNKQLLTVSCDTSYFVHISLICKKHNSVFFKHCRIASTALSSRGVQTSLL